MTNSSLLRFISFAALSSLLLAGCGAAEFNTNQPPQADAVVGGQIQPGGNDLGLVAADAGPFETAQDTPVAIPKKNILSYVTSRDGRPFQIARFEAPPVGTLKDNGDELNYTPGSGFTGTVRFKYIVEDNAGAQAWAAVIVNVRPPTATDPIYIHTSSVLYSMSADMTGPQKIADIRLNGAVHEISDIAISRQGVMYAVDNENLYALDAHTGALTLVKEFFHASIPVGMVTGLTFLSDGRLVVGGTGLFILDASNRDSITPLVNGTYQTSGDIIGLPDHYLYWTVNVSGENDHLLRVDPNSGGVTDLGALSVNSVWGLAYANQTLYGVASNGESFRISQYGPGVQLTLDSIHNFGLGALNGATTNPVFW